MRRGIPFRALIATAAVVGAATTLLVTVGGPASAAPTACPATYVFEVDGYGSGPNLRNWTASAFNRAVPAGVEIVEVPYEDGVFPVVDDLALDAAVDGGAGVLLRTIADRHAACPAARLTIAGYSEGAVVADEVIATLAASTAIPHAQIDAVLYGNPRRPVGEGGRGGRAGGIETNLPTILPGVTMRGPATYGDIAVRDVCNENDGICNSTNLVTNALAFVNGLVGYVQTAHKYDLNPVRDAGRGLLFVRQAPLVPYGPALPLPIGTPYELQQALHGHGDARATVRNVRGVVAAAAEPAGVARLRELPWFRVIGAA